MKNKKAMISFLAGVIISGHSLAQIEIETAWASATTSGSGDATSTLVDQDSDGNTYVGSYFNGTINLDPPTNAQSVTSNGGFDFMVSKYDPDGHLIWVHTFGDSDYDVIKGLKVTSNDDIIITGSFSETVDFDPGAGVFNATADKWDNFLLSLDSDGNFNWVKTMTGIGFDTVEGIALDATGNIIMVGKATPNYDFDPSASTFSFGSDTKGFLAKYDADGDFLWAKELDTSDGSSPPNPNSVTIDNQSRIIITGYFFGTMKFDEAGTKTATSEGGRDIFVGKYNASGSALWGFGVGGADSDYGHTVAVDEFRNIYVGGTFEGSVDFNPGASVYSIDANGDHAGFVQKVDENGGFEWVYYLKPPTTGTTSVYSIDVNFSDLYVGGRIRSGTDLNPEGDPNFVSFSNSYKSYLLNLTTDRSYQSVNVYGGVSTNNYVYDLSANDDGQVFVTGVYDGSSADFGSHSLSTGAVDGFLLNVEKCRDVVETSISACTSYTFDGQVLTTSDTYQATFTNAAGCDSVVVLDLTIYNQGICWEEGGWSGSEPTETDDAIITVDYSTDTNGNLDVADLIIANGVAFTVNPDTEVVIAGDIQNNGELVVESGGNLFVSDQTISGNPSYEGNPAKFIRNTRYANDLYSLVGIPVKQDASNTTDLLGPIVYTYDESIAYHEGTEDGVNRWNRTSTDQLHAGVGYAAAGQQTITIEGFPNNESWFVTLGRTEDATTTDDNWGWHLVSNPYSTALDISTFIAENTGIQGAIALWDDPGSDNERGTNADYLIANSIGSVGGPNGGQFEGYIGSMQGFFVQVGDGQDGRLHYKMNMRSSNNSDANFFRTDEIPSFKLTMTNQDENYSETLIGFPEDATAGLDRLYDAARFKSQSQFNLSTLLEEKSLAIQGLPMKEEMEIPLIIDHENDEKVTFNLTQSSLPDYVAVWLKDPSGMQFELRVDKPIQMDLQSGKNIKGYSIMLRSRNILGLEHPHFSVTVDGNFIIAKPSQDQEIQNIKLMDLMGRELNLEVVREGQNVQIKKPLVSGVYILSVETNDDIIRTKLLIDD